MYETYLGLQAALRDNPESSVAKFVHGLVYTIIASYAEYGEEITETEAFDILRKVMKIQKSKSLTLGHAIGAYIYQAR